MKKILFVDNTEANLDVAKAFFSTIKAFEFVYATNRKEVETLLPEVDAVITSPSIFAEYYLHLCNGEIQTRNAEVK